MKNIAIIDDDERDISNLSEHLKRYFAEKNIAVNIDLYRNATMFLERFDHQFNLVFFDIEMPELDGISLAKAIREKDEVVRIIFVSNHPKYAIEGYGLNALSFLVKPITYESLFLKMNSILPIIDVEEEKQISFKNRDSLKTIYVKDIVNASVKGHYIDIYLSDGSEFETRGPLGVLEDQINSNLFAKSSHSDIINIKFIKQIEDNSVVLNNGKKIGITRSYKKEFMEAVLAYFGKK